jgi:hypothetical protein
MYGCQFVTGVLALPRQLAIIAVVGVITNNGVNG